MKKNICTLLATLSACAMVFVSVSFNKDKTKDVIAAKSGFKDKTMIDDMHSRDEIGESPDRKNVSDDCIDGVIIPTGVDDGSGVAE